MARRPFIWLGRSLLAVFGLLVILVASLLIIRPTFNIDRLSPALEDELREATGVPISIGVLRLRTSLWPTIIGRDIRVQVPGGSGTENLAHVDGLELRISLLPLLRRRLNIVQLRLEGVRVEPRGSMRKLEFEQPDRASTADWMLVGVRHFEVVDLVVRLGDEQLDEIDLASIVGRVSQTDPLEIDVVGRLDTANLRIEIDGPPIGNLLSPPEVLPLTTRFELAEFAGSADVRASTTRISVDDLEGELYGEAFAGSIVVDLSSTPIGVTGGIELARLDAASWMREQTPRDSAASDDDDALVSLRGVPGFDIPYDLLEQVDADFRLSIGSIEGLNLPVQEAVASLGLSRGELDLPITFRLAGSAVDSRLRVDSLDRVSLEVQLQEIDLERLRHLHEALEPITGFVNRLDLTASTSGSTLASLIEQSTLDIDIESSQLILSSLEHQQSIDIDIRHLQARRRADQLLTIQIRGALLDQKFDLDIDSDDLFDLRLGEPWSIDLALQSLGLRSRFESTVTPTAGSPEIHSTFRLAGDRLADLSNWLGTLDWVELPFDLTGEIDLTADSSTILLSEGRLGKSRFSAQTRRTRTPDDHLSIALDVETLDTPEIKSFVDPFGDQQIVDDLPSLDLPLLPGPLEIPDTDLQARVARVVREPEDIVDLELDLEYSERRLEISTLSFRVGSGSFEGGAHLGWVDVVPRIDIDLDSTSFDLADVIATDRVAEGLEARAEKLSLSFRSEGTTLRELLSLDSDIELSGRGITAQMPLGRTGEQLDLRLASLSASAPVGQPLSGQSVGTLNGLDTEIDLEVTSDRRVTVGEVYPIVVTSRFDQVRTELRGDLRLPLDLDNQHFELNIEAPTLASFDSLVHKQLPPVGPVFLSASLSPAVTGFEVAIDRLGVGDSELSGTVVLDTSGTRPYADATLDARRLQPNDFLTDHLDSADSHADSPSRAGRSLRFPEDLAWLQSFDGQLTLDIGEFVWAGTTPGRGEVRARLDDGRLTLEQFHLDQEASGMDLAASLAVGEGGAESIVDLRLEKFRYGPLLRALGSADEEDGTLTVDTSLRMEGSTVDELVSSSRGYLDFTLYPHAVDTALLDLWAAGPSSVLRALNPNSQSVLNCLAGRFSIADGLMTADGLHLDTSRIRARGKGEIDLVERSIAMKLRPRPKRRTFMNLATPVKVSGPLDDPEMRVGLGGLAGTAFRISTWFVTVYFEIFRQPLPSDGADICVDPVPRQTTSAPGPLHP